MKTSYLLFTAFCLVAVVCVGLCASSCGSGGQNSDGQDYEPAPELTPYTLSLHRKYDRIYQFHNGMAIVRTKYKKRKRYDYYYGLINAEGQEIIPCRFEDLTTQDYRSYLAYPDDGDNILYIVEDGKATVFPVPDGYEAIHNGFNKEGLAEVWTPKKAPRHHGLMNEQGKIVVPCRYNDIGYFKEGMAIVENDHSHKGYINIHGEEVVPTKYWNAYNFSDGRGRVENDDNLYGYVDQEGNEVIPCAYERATSFRHGMAGVCKDGMWALIDRDGKPLTPFQYDGIWPMENGLICYMEYNRYGFMDKELNRLTVAQYNEVSYYGDGMTVVKQNYRSGYIDDKGREVIPCIYSRIGHPFSRGYARVARDGMAGYIDKEGHEVVMLPTKNYADVNRSGYDVITFRDAADNLFLFDMEGNRLDDNGLPTPTVAMQGNSPSATNNSNSGSAPSSPAYVAPPVPSTSSGTSDPARRAEWEMKRNNAMQELARLQAQLVAEPNSSYLKQLIRNQQNIIQTCNEMIALYQ